MNLHSGKVLLSGLALVCLTSGLAFADGRKSLESTWFYDGGKPVADRSLPAITLEGGNLTGTDSCNRLLGSYKLKGKRSIRFMAASTMMMCPDMTLANAFHKGLDAARSYEVKNGMLVLRGKSGQSVLVLNRLNK